MPNWPPGPWKWVYDAAGPVWYLRSVSAIAHGRTPEFNGIDPILDDGSAGGEYPPTIDPATSPAAHLIAKAPELYAALEHLVELAASFQPNPEHYEALRQARAVLAEARGEKA